jgi:anti-sigma B factor antagonist
MFGRKKKNPAPAPDQSPAPAADLMQSHHFAAELRGGIIYGEVRTEQITERESKLLLDEIAQATDASGSDKLAIDMKHVGVLASAGIGMLVQVHKRLKGTGGGIAIYNLNDDIAQLMKLTRMDKLFTIADSREHAVKSLS